MQENNNITCSFCGKPRTKARLVAVSKNGKAAVCQDCAVLLYDQFDEILYAKNELPASKKKEQPAQNGAMPVPSEIVDALNKKVVGHESAKKALAVAVYNHYKRIQNGNTTGKSNILLIGPTGSGKTYLLENIAKLVGVPFVTVDATAFTQKGYVGLDTEDIVLSLIRKANGNIQLASQGIVYIDEVDKLAGDSSIGRDVGGRGVQQDLLKMMEGNKVQITDGYGRVTEFDTKGILFICGGAFSGLDEIIQKREKKHAGLGFGSSMEKKTDEAPKLVVGPKSARIEDLVEYGMMPEFLGRTPIIATIGQLTQEEMEKVLTGVDGCLVSEYTNMLKMDGVNLSFTQDAVSEIAKQAIAANTGARALRGICENVLLDLMYKAPRSDIKSATITKDTILLGTEPVIERKEGRSQRRNHQQHTRKAQGRTDGGVERRKAAAAKEAQV